ncbi:MAG: hypothetical protein MESAZ_01025 [Saezia sanguinis]
MMAFIASNMAPIMFAFMVVLLLSGFPVAFSLAACGLIFGFAGIWMGLLPQSLFHALPLRVFGIMQNETLLAIPFFTLMGLILERSGMAEDLLETAGQVFGPVRGGLAFAILFVGVLLSATTGVIAASVISMGLISLPIMLRYGYSPSIASGTIAASGTLAQIVPPSLALIVIADQLGKSVGDMFRGALIPSLMLIAAFAIYLALVAFFRPKAMPALPPEVRTFKEPNGQSGIRSMLWFFTLVTLMTVVFACFYPQITSLIAGHERTPRGDEVVIVSLVSGTILAWLLAMLNRLLGLGLLSRMTERMTFVLIPPLALIFLVLGSIFLGVATPTEGGAMGAVGAMVMGMLRGKLNFKTLHQALKSTTELSCFVLMILIGSTIFSFTFTAVDGNHWVEHLFDKLPGGQLGFLIFVSIVIFILGCFLDYFEISFILIPLLAPIANKLGIDLIWFGILIGVNLQTSFLTPPFGFALFFLRSVAPIRAYIDKVTGKRIEGIQTLQIYKGTLPFIGLQLLVLAILIAFPILVTGMFDQHDNLDTENVQIQIEGNNDWGNNNAW